MAVSGGEKMKPTAADEIESRVSRYTDLLKQRQLEPDPFQILNVARTESPYTHFLGWLLNPSAVHPWKADFLSDLLASLGYSIPDGIAERALFHVETFNFQKA